MLKKTFGPKRKEVTGDGWKKPHTRSLIFQGRCYGQDMWHVCGGENTCTFSVWKYVGKKPRGIHRYRWEDNIKKDFKAKGCQDVNWFHLALDRDKWQAVVNTVLTTEFCKRRGIYTLAEELSTVQADLCSL
jgi:hypothetical protein